MYRYILELGGGKLIRVKNYGRQVLLDSKLCSRKKNTYLRSYFYAILCDKTNLTMILKKKIPKSIMLIMQGHENIKYLKIFKKKYHLVFYQTGNVKKYYEIK